MCTISSHLKELAKEEQTKPKVRGKEIIEINTKSTMDPKWILTENQQSKKLVLSKD